MLMQSVHRKSKKYNLGAKSLGHDVIKLFFWNESVSVKIGFFDHDLQLIIADVNAQFLHQSSQILCWYESGSFVVKKWKYFLNCFLGDLDTSVGSHYVQKLRKVKGWRWSAQVAYYVEQCWTALFKSLRWHCCFKFWIMAQTYILGWWLLFRWRRTSQKLILIMRFRRLIHQVFDSLGLWMYLSLACLLECSFSSFERYNSFKFYNKK